MRARRARAVVGEVAARLPSPAYSAAAAFAPVSDGRIRARRRAPTAAEIARLMPHLTPAQAEAAARDAWANWLRYQTLQAAIRRRGIRAVRPLLADDGGLSGIEPPVVLGAFHLGPVGAPPAAVEPVPGEVVALRRNAARDHARNATVVKLGFEEHERVRALHTAAVALKEGRSAFVTLDAERAARIEAPLFGGAIALARGGIALGRIASVPIVPLAARWERSRMVVERGPALPPADEATTAAGAAAWLEDYLLARPGEVTPFLLARLRPATEGPR